MSPYPSTRRRNKRDDKRETNDLTIEGFVAKENEKRAAKPNSMQNPQFIFFSGIFSRKNFQPNGLEQPGSRRRPAFGREAAGTMRSGECYSTGQKNMVKYTTGEQKWGRFSRAKFHIVFQKSFEEREKGKITTKKTGKRGDWISDSSESTIEGLNGVGAALYRTDEVFCIGLYGLGMPRQYNV